MKAIPLTAQLRDVTGKKVAVLRKQELVPATVYGHEVKSVSLSLPLKEFLKIYSQAGKTGLIDLKWGSDAKSVLISNIQFHPLTRQPLNVEFHAVKLTEKIKANVPLVVVGESAAVSSNVGLLLQTLNEVEVEALPTDLPEKIEVDISNLAEIDQQLTVGDLKVPQGVEMVTPKEELVVKVVPAVSEEAKKEAEEAAAKAAAQAATEGGEVAPAAEGTAAPEAKTEPAA